MKTIVSIRTPSILTRRVEGILEGRPIASALKVLTARLVDIDVPRVLDWVDANRYWKTSGLLSKVDGGLNSRVSQVLIPIPSEITDSSRLRHYRLYRRLIEREYLVGMLHATREKAVSKKLLRTWKPRLHVAM